MAPAKRFFSTRHTMMCVYNFVDAAAVELLGYLPHDMVGTSIFDYYHPDDLPLLLNAYEEGQSLFEIVCSNTLFKLKWMR